MPDMPDMPEIPAAPAAPVESTPTLRSATTAAAHDEGGDEEPGRRETSESTSSVGSSAGGSAGNTAADTAGNTSTVGGVIVDPPQHAESKSILDSIEQAVLTIESDVANAVLGAVYRLRRILQHPH